MDRFKYRLTQQLFYGQADPSLPPDILKRARAKIRRVYTTQELGNFVSHLPIGLKPCEATWEDSIVSESMTNGGSVLSGHARAQWKFS